MFFVELVFAKIMNALHNCLALDEVETAYTSVAHLSKELEELRAESIKHTQFAAAVENVKHIVNVPENVERARRSIDEGELLIAYKFIADLDSSRNGLLFELYKQQNDSPTDKNFIKQYFSDVDKLSEQLEKQLWIIVSRTLAYIRREPTILVTAVRIIEREEMNDEFYMKRQQLTGFVAPARPKKWKEKCFNVLEDAVATKIEANQIEDRSAHKMWLVRHLEVTRQLLLEDLKVIKTLCEPCFPPHYDIVNRLVKMYHDCLSKRLQDLEVEGNEIISLLNWINSYSGPDLMQHPQLMFDTTQLGPLLDPSTVNSLTEKYLKTLDGNIKEWVENTLNSEIKDWNRDAEPEADRHGFFQTAVPIILFQMIEQHLQVAAQISDDLVISVLALCTDKVTNFAKNYKNKVEDFKRQHDEGRRNAENVSLQVIPYYVHYMTAIVNNCDIFCELAEKFGRNYLTKPEHERKLGTKLQDLTTVFQEVLDMTCHFLEEEVFLDVTVHVQELVSKQWLMSTTSVDTICITVEDYSSDFVHLRKKYFHKVMEMIERRLVCEYIKAIMQKKVSFKTYEERKEAADKLVLEANQMESLFNKVVNLEGKELGCDALRQVCELLSLKDPSLLSLEIHGLAKKYPDITVDHIIAILSLRGDIAKSEIRQTVTDLMPTDPANSQQRTIFSEIPSPQSLFDKLKI